MPWQMHHESLGLPLHFLCAPSTCRSESLPQAFGSYRGASARLLVEVTIYGLSRDSTNEQAPPEAWSVKRENPLTWGEKNALWKDHIPVHTSLPYPSLTVKGLTTSRLDAYTPGA